jgi:hypothetical protein
MSTTIGIIIVTALLTAGQTQLPVSGNLGSIKGKVVDANGVGIAGAKVYDEPLDAVRIGKDHFVTTDSDGRFVLSDVPPGKTMVIATKPEAGYPDARFALYSGNEVLPTVDVHADQTTSEVVVKLLAKGALVRGKIVDSHSMLPVSKARITLSRVDHPQWSLETDPEDDGTFEFLIPSRPIRFQVTAEGFRTWTYEASSLSKNHAPLTLGPQEKRNLDVYLERIK